MHVPGEEEINTTSALAPTVFAHAQRAASRRKAGENGDVAQPKLITIEQRNRVP
jgi:hypothetical protein